MRDRLLCVICAVLTLNLTACTTSIGSKLIETETPDANISYAIDETQATFLDTTFDNPKLSEFFPVTKDGKTCALIRLNQIEKLGIYDWTSAEAVDAGIKYSYTFNFTLRSLTTLKNGENTTFYVTPEFKQGDTVTGKSCIVGWSGFPQTAVFNKDTDEAYIEYGVQPLKKVSDKTRLVIKISDSDGNTYDDIIFSKSIFKHVVKGPGLHTDGSAVTIKGASGAKYSINVYNVMYAEVYNDCYIVEDKSDVPELPSTQTLVYNYRVDYLSEPTKKKVEVSNIDTSKKSGSMLSTDLSITVQGNSDNTLYTERRKKLYWFEYSNKLKMTSFTSTKHYKIHKGTYAYYTDNRDVPDAFIKSSKRIRFNVELSSDALSMTPQQLMKFNGRFLVFERVPEQRVAPKYHKGNSRIYISYTSDERHE